MSIVHHALFQMGIVRAYFALANVTGPFRATSFADVAGSIRNVDDKVAMPHQDTEACACPYFIRHSLLVCPSSLIQPLRSFPCVDMFIVFRLC